jgi:hypothetical protein
MSVNDKSEVRHPTGEKGAPLLRARRILVREEQYLAENGGLNSLFKRKIAVTKEMRGFVTSKNCMDSLMKMKFIIIIIININNF